MQEVLLFTYYWPPSGGAGVQRWLKFTKYLPDLGIAPTIITVNPEIASYPVRDETLIAEIPANIKIIQTHSFEPLKLYQQLNRQKQIPYAGFANEQNTGWKEQLSRFIRGNLFIPDARRGWNKYAIKAAQTLLPSPHIQTIITTGPPHSTHLIGVHLKQKHQLRWIADIRDPWTDIYYYHKLNHTAVARYIDSRLEKKVLEQADYIVVVSEFIKQLFIKKSRLVNPNKIIVIPNGYDETDFIHQAPTRDTNKFVISYNGTLTTDYPAAAFVEALALVTQKKDPSQQVVLQFTGTVPLELRNTLNSTTGVHCIFNKRVSHAESVAILQNSDALLLLIPEVAQNEGILTGKLFEYLGSQKPIICIGPKQGNAAQIIEECQAGKTFDKQEIKEISDFILQLTQKHYAGNFTQNTNLNYTRYSRKNLSAAMAGLIK